MGLINWFFALVLGLGGVALLWRAVCDVLDEWYTYRGEWGWSLVDAIKLKADTILIAACWTALGLHLAAHGWGWYR